MGVDFLDFGFRIEKRFGITIGREDYDRLPKRTPFDMTAGELHEWVVDICRRRNVKVPVSSWNRVRLALASVVGKPPQTIHRETLIREELDFI